MDVSAVSNASVSQNFKSQFSSHIDVHKAEKNEEAHKARHDKHSHDRSYRSRALDVFRTELKIKIRASFRAQLPISQTAYAETQGEPSADDVANETLGVARQLVSDAPTTSGKALITFRAQVHETATYIRETLAAQDDASDVDDVVARVDGGLDELENEVARNRESVATALEVDTQSKQRSTIKIRTQEGDIVKLSISRSDRTSISDTSSNEDGNFSSTTEIEISSRSRLTLKVEGDLNDEELAAIQNVFAQAESIADEFFGGDLAATFDLAAGFEFDTEQLARVKLGFRSYQSSSIAYTEAARLTPSIDAPAAAIAPPQPGPPIGIAAPVATTAVPANTVESELAQAETATETPVAPADTSPVDASALSELFGLVSDFLRSISDGFGAAVGESSNSFQFHYSESFKLTLLSAVINAVAPAESDNSAAAITTVIDGLTTEAKALNVAA